MTRILVLVGACLLASCATVEDTGLGSRGTEKRCQDVTEGRSWFASEKCGAGGCSAEIMGDGIDQDCDGKDNCYEDLDNDGFGSAVVVQTNNGCEHNGKSAVSGDCQDEPNCIGDQYFPGNPKGAACGSGEDFDCTLGTCGSDVNCGCGSVIPCEYL